MITQIDNLPSITKLKISNIFVDRFMRKFQNYVPNQQS